MEGLIYKYIYTLATKHLLYLWWMKGEEMKHQQKFYQFKAIITLLLALTFILTSVQNVYADNDHVEIPNNSAIETVIEKKSEDTLIPMTDKEIEKFLSETSDNSQNALKDKSLKEIEKYFSTVESGTSAKNNTNGGIITSPVSFLHNTVGNNTDTYTATKRVVITGVGNKLLSDLEVNANCCTLTSLYNIMVYYRDVKKYSKIPTTLSSLYKKLRNQATNLGYTTDDGIGVTKNNNLVTNTWRDGFGYTSGQGLNNYLWTNSTAIHLLDDKKPFMFSLASGAYYNHTITIYGYVVYQNNRTNSKYTFLYVYDGWSRTPRYLAWTNTPTSYVACLTSITTP